MFFFRCTQLNCNFVSDSNERRQLIFIKLLIIERHLILVNNLFVIIYHCRCCIMFLFSLFINLVLLHKINLYVSCMYQFKGIQQHIKGLFALNTMQISSLVNVFSSGS